MIDRCPKIRLWISNISPIYLSVLQKVVSFPCRPAAAIHGQKYFESSRKNNERNSSVHNSVNPYQVLVFKLFHFRWGTRINMGREDKHRESINIDQITG